MGYNNRFSGAITITPPLTWSDIQNGPRLQDVQLRVCEEKRTAVVDGAEAEVIVRTADAIVPLDMEYSGHQLEEDIQAIIDHYEGYGFAGFIEARWDAGFGEPPSRFIVKDDRVMRIDAQYRWPGIWADEQPQDERDAQLADLATELDAANDNADEIADRAGKYREEIMRLRARVTELEQQLTGAQARLDYLEGRSSLTPYRRAALQVESERLRKNLEAAQAERDGATQAVAEAVSILEGMLNEDAWAYDAGRARGVLLDYFARDLDALDTRDTKAGE